MSSGQSAWGVCTSVFSQVQRVSWFFRPARAGLVPTIVSRRAAHLVHQVLLVPFWRILGVVTPLDLVLDRGGAFCRYFALSASSARWGAPDPAGQERCSGCLQQICQATGQPCTVTPVGATHVRRRPPVVSWGFWSDARKGCKQNPAN